MMLFNTIQRIYSNTPVKMICPSKLKRVVFVSNELKKGKMITKTSCSNNLIFIHIFVDGVKVFSNCLTPGGCFFTFVIYTTIKKIFICEN